MTIFYSELCSQKKLKIVTPYHLERSHPLSGKYLVILSANFDVSPWFLNNI